jgi:ABC-type multidrug transport system ATPase subunit
MKRICYIEIENFKVFDKKIHIDLGHPAVLIGPNNAGKTSVIQALALWNRGIRAWYEKKGRPRQKEKRERLSAGINRLGILEVPVSETRFFWSNTRVRKGNTPIEMIINIALQYEGRVDDCRLIFKQRDSEIIYCRPCEETVSKEKLLAYAATMQFSLLYPMSGIETEEPFVQEGRINVLMGQGQTAQVLRNLCFKVKENDEASQTNDWRSIVKLMKRLFSVDLKEPRLNMNRGTLVLKYRQKGIENDLDISLAGRGLQQLLLILAYLYSHKNSVLLIDEPDAHLEILRQKQVYEILKDAARENRSQVVIATHSEVILDDAVETNLTLLINGESVDLATESEMRHALRTFGIEHYYKAKVLPRILYIEGSTDLDNLKALARKLEHDAYDVLSGKLNYYYTQDSLPEDSLEKRIEKTSGAYHNYNKHYNTLKGFVKGLKGIAIFDGDAREVEDDIGKNLAVVYWKDYELENYFITPEVILKFAESHFASDGPLFKPQYFKGIKEIIDDRLLEMVFEGDKGQLKEFKAASKKLRRTLLKGIKVSKFTENVFKDFSKKHNQPILLKKGEFHRLIEFVNKRDIPGEVSEKLDLIVKYLKWE